jgi:hypothetical protein
VPCGETREEALTQTARLKDLAAEKKRRRIEAAERADVWEPETADADANQIEEDSDSNAELELPTEQAGAASVRARRAG